MLLRHDDQLHWAVDACTRIPSRTLFHVLQVNLQQVFAWLHKLGLKEADLHTEEKMDLDFILNGISSLLGNKEYSAPSYFTGFFRRNLGKGVRETLYQLSLKNQSFDNAAF